MDSKAAVEMRFPASWGNTARVREGVTGEILFGGVLVRAGWGGGEGEDVRELRGVSMGRKQWRIL